MRCASDLGSIYVRHRDQLLGIKHCVICCCLSKVCPSLDARALFQANTYISASTSVSPVPAPSVLPSCLQTWIKLSGCKDNSDANCFCNDKDFTKNVQECISAWSNDKGKESQAFSYLAGICAPHVNNNPGIITGIPSTITLQPIPAPTVSNSPQSAAAAPGGQTPAPSNNPSTVLSLSTTVTVQCPAAYTTLSGSAAVSAASMQSGCTTTTVLNTQVTVPQVAFATPTPGKVGLVAGTPAAAPAQPTNANSPQQPAASPAPAASNANSPVAPAAAPPAPAVPAPSGNAGSTGSAIQPSTSVTPFTGAAAKVGSSSVFMSVFLAVAGLAVFV